MITRVPKMLTANKRKLTETFDYVHNVMNIPHHLIVRFPQVRSTQPSQSCHRPSPRTVLWVFCKNYLLFGKELDQYWF